MFCLSSSMQTKRRVPHCQDLAWDKLDAGQAGLDGVWDSLWESPSISPLSPSRWPGWAVVLSEHPVSIHLGAPTVNPSWVYHAERR